MTRKFHNTKCVYCLRYLTELTSDHLFPKAWCLNGTPVDLRAELNKLQVPACYKCNQKWSKIEDDFFVKLGLCVDPTDHIYSKVCEKSVRSAKQSCAKNERDQIIRKGRLKKIMSDTVPLEHIPKQSIVPGFDPWAGFETGVQVGIKVPSSQFKGFGEKLVRGFSYQYRNGTYIDQNHKIQIFIPKREGYNINEIIRQTWQKHVFYPTLSIKLAFTVDDDQSGLFDIIIWNKLRMFGVVEPRNINQEKKFYEKNQEKANT